jgi:hypothetical protein
VPQTRQADGHGDGRRDQQSDRYGQDQRDVPFRRDRDAVRADTEEGGMADADHARATPGEVESEREQPVGQRQRQQRQRVGGQDEGRGGEHDRRQRETAHMPAFDPSGASRAGAQHAAFRWRSSTAGNSSMEV